MSAFSHSIGGQLQARTNYGIRLYLRIVILCFLLALGHGSLTPKIIYVSPSGDDKANGTSPNSALRTCAAAVHIVQSYTAAKWPPGGLQVQFSAGSYPLSLDTTCGELMNIRGTKAAPLVFAGAGSQHSANDQQTIFDATSLLDANALRPISDPKVASIINPAAKGKILELNIPADSGYSGGQLLWNGVPLTPSVWPNVGLGYVRRVFDAGAVYAVGRTKGPPPTCHICLGSNKSSTTSPCGANISLAQQPKGDWAAELVAGPGFGSVVLSGYLSNDWYHESHHIIRVEQTSRNTSVQFASYSRYGICEALETHGSCGGTAPGRFKVTGLLSEVDIPGEFWYNKVTRMLYMYPLPSFADIDAKLGFPFGPELITITNTTWVTMRDVAISGSTGMAIQINNGSENTVGGCVITGSAGGVSITGGHHNRILGNDIYDVGTHISTQGDAEDNLQNLIPTNNLVANNHLTQVHQRGTWQIHIRGMGDRFSHNLVHDAAGQVILPAGPLTMIDHNEVFNTGYQEGDGGVMYIGASLTAGWGMQYRKNFIHHSLEVPGLHGRGGIYFDDHFIGVTNCSGNVMYKAAGRAFLVNGGAANKITNNLMVNGAIGIYNQHADDMTRDLPLYDNGTLKRGDKGDYIWRTEQVLGVQDFESVFSTPLAKRFPTFGRLLAINSTIKGWASPAKSNFSNNVFLNNSNGNICLLTSYHPPNNEFCDTQLEPKPGEPKFIDQDGSLEAEWSWFPDSLSTLDFVNFSLGFNTKEMGLYCDKWRKALPVSSLYRPWVRATFASVPSSASGPYTPGAAAIRASMQSGLALTQNFTRPCPSPARQIDCRAIWVTWGECEQDGYQVVRYTIEREVSNGGEQCKYEDGYAQRRKCI